MEFFDFYDEADLEEEVMEEKPYQKNRKRDEKRKQDFKKEQKRAKLSKEVYGIDEDEICSGKLRKDFYSCDCSVCKAEKSYNKVERDKMIEEEFDFKEITSLEDIEDSLEQDELKMFYDEDSPIDEEDWKKYVIN